MPTRLRGSVPIHPALRYLVFALCVLAPSRASATVILSENARSGLIDAESCATSEGGTSCGPSCSTSCDERESNRVQVAINQCVAGVPLGSRIVTGDLWTDFRIDATEGTEGNHVSAQVEYDIWWHGYWCMGVSLEKIKSARADVWLDVIDVDDGGRVVHREYVHSLDAESDIDFFNEAIAFGAGTDKGSRATSFAVLLRRGRHYRARLRLRAETELSVTVGYLGLDYKSRVFERGAGWNELRISVGQDARGVVEGLQAQIDTLRHRLENHAHDYLTGRGEGHNNTVAQTGRPIFFDDTGTLPGFVEPPPGAQALPTRSELLPGVPNPTGTHAMIGFTLPEPASTRIELFNVRGQRVRTLLDEARSAGEHRIALDATELPVGVYYYTLRAGLFHEARKIVIAR